VASREGECFTTVYKNALAAMVFIHEGTLSSAEGIFDFFDGVLTSSGASFSGFTQSWNPCSGMPTDQNYWEGDNAFLLLALNYYALHTGDAARYATLSQKLVQWLLIRADHCDEIIAEGVGNMYAALKPHASNTAVTLRLPMLKSCFESTVDYAHVLDHTVRGALVFGDQSGFDFVPNFQRTEMWINDGQPIMALSAFSGDANINVEVSSQMLLASIVSGRAGQLGNLQTELEKLWLADSKNTGKGLPYFVRNTGFGQSALLPIIDPTCYMLFAYWNFNPFSSESK
jgi:hypothetical protein